jgi:sugar phosphate isomerase/epimerase
MTQLVLSNVSLMTTPLPEVMSAASTAGFDGISVIARSHRYAVERGGLTNADLRAIAADHGVTITEVETTGDWLTSEPDDAPASVRTVVYPTHELLDITAELGAPTMTAVHPGAARPLDESAEAFAKLCDRAAVRGLRVALEFVPWMGIGSLAAGWDVVRTADRPNGGLLVDLWHHRRSSHDDDLLESIPADRIFSVQVCDATAAPRGPLVEDVQYRMLPGRGDLDVVGFLRTLTATGVDAPIGVEVFDGELVAQGAEHAARELYSSLADVVTRSGGP